MSLLHALDPGASPSRPGCEARGCRSTSTTSVRAYLGRPHATTIRVCETHRRALEVAGELEHPVNCLIPECGRVRATPSRLCAQHEAIVAAAKITIPRKGVIGAETLLAVRRAVEAEEKRQATIAAAPPVRPRMEEPTPDYLGACWEHLRDHVAGGTRIDMAVGEVVDLLKQTRKNLARREKDWESAVRIAELRGDEVRAASAALTALGVPVIQADHAEPQYDLVARIKRLAMRPTVQPEPVPADVLQPEAIGGQKFAADLIMAALNGRLAEMPAGVELSLQLALTGVVGLLASERGAVAQRDALEQTIQAISEALDDDGAPAVDGKKVKTIADRVGALIGRWQDEIRETICAVVPAPDRIDGGACDSGDPLDLTLAEVTQGLTQLQEQIDAQKAARPAPAAQPDPLRIQAQPADGLRVAVEWALDEAKAPQAASLTDRIAALAKQRNELCVHLVAIREALNVGPASDSDVRLETPLEELARIVRARTVCMLEERDQRVALAEEVEALKRTLGDPLAPAVDALVAWLSGPGGEQAHKGFKTGLLYALYRRAIEPMAAAEALGGLRALARLILSTPEPFDLPF